ncbi:MAG: ribosomal protein S18-alanine N-acetyltransferase [Chloroflexi bacterium]|nr:ribosomal protein S18-alanine N-acetyltransferase [Chloroflexota bacterium]
MDPTPASVSLREMTPEDIPSVQRIESAAYEDAWPARLFAQELENAFGHYLVAVERTGGRGEAPEDGRIVGFMGVWFMTDQLHLVTIAIDPAHQGRGLGQRLLLECLDLAREAELNEVVLEVRESNARARALYDAFGFRRAGELRDYYKDNHETAIVMLSGPLTDAGPRLDAIRARLQDEHPELFAD